jgi:hypothetical protein
MSLAAHHNCLAQRFVQPPRACEGGFVGSAQRRPRQICRLGGLLSPSERALVRVALQPSFWEMTKWRLGPREMPTMGSCPVLRARLQLEPRCC